MGTTAVQDKCTVTVALIKQALRMDPSNTSKDDYLGILLAASKIDADDYLENPFTGLLEDPDLQTWLPVVNRWVLADVVRAFNMPDPTVTHQVVTGAGGQTRDITQVTRFAGLSLRSKRNPLASTPIGNLPP
jgi:hypothetical protein